MRKIIVMPEEIMKSRTTQEDLEYFQSQGIDVRIGLSEKGGKLLDKIRDADGLVMATAEVGKALFDKCDTLKVVAAFGVGFDYIDVNEATRHGVVVFNVPGLFSDAVANLTIAHMLSITRKVTIGDRGVKKSEWASVKPACMGTDLQGKVLGTVGLGSVGYNVAKKCMSAFSMSVVTYDPFISQEKAKELKIKKVETLQELLAESDIVTIHCPLTDQTRGLIGANELSLMKPSSLLINTARGGIVDEKALFYALKNSIIAGAALDVMEKEPPAADNPLLTLDNIVITPHIGASTYESIRAVYRVVRENVCRVITGNLPKPPARIVNEEVLTATVLRFRTNI
jgi:D-3-phosphoglycerate dehydrogenase